MRTHRSAQRGITPVEPVIVVLILGILLAVALPRSMNLGAEARKKKLEAALGSVKAATQLTRAAALMAGGSALDDDDSIMQDGVVVETVHGYPKASAEGIVRATGLDPAGDRISISINGSAVTFAIQGAPAEARCSFTYVQSSRAVLPPTISSLTTSGC
jgi:MSHA pilin protein MshA